MFVNQLSYPEHSEKFLTIQDAVLRYVVITGKPISIVSNEDFLFLIGKLNDKYKCAGRNHEIY